jgi:hypothetical protein
MCDCLIEGEIIAPLFLFLTTVVIGYLDKEMKLDDSASLWIEARSSDFGEWILISSKA